MIALNQNSVTHPHLEVSATSEVAQTFCLLYRRVALGSQPNALGVRHNWTFITQRTASRLQVCDTAERELCPVATD
jgi:hypothetical protein